MASNDRPLSGRREVTLPAPPLSADALALQQLRREVDELRAELERRDVEQIAVENAVEFLHSQSSSHLWALGAITLALWGRRGTGAEVINHLYPHAGPSGANGAGNIMVYERPSRRWAQFGSRKELLELAAENGVPMTSRDTYSREGMVRRLWRARVLPGSIALFDEKNARERRGSIVA